MIRIITLVANIFGLVVVATPLFFWGYISLKNGEASSVAIIGGEPGGATATVFSFSANSFDNLIPMVLLIILLCLNIYTISSHNFTLKR